MLGCWAQEGSCRPSKTEAQAPRAGMKGWRGRGMGGPATAGKRWPHFFQMGKLRHKEVWELAQGHSQ